jgi:hypothetical protein
VQTAEPTPAGDDDFGKAGGASSSHARWKPEDVSTGGSGAPALVAPEETPPPTVQPVVQSFDQALVDEVRGERAPKGNARDKGVDS